MSRLAQVSALIRDTYAAALTPGEWPQVMQRMLALIGGTAAIVFTRELNCQIHGFECAVGVEAHLWATALAPQGEAALFRHHEESEPVGTVFSAAAAAVKTPGNQVAWRMEFIGTLLERLPTGISGLYIRRRRCARRADTRSRAMLGLLAPHICQSLCISRRLQSDASAFALRMQQAAGRYGLTPAEVRVVQALLDGCTIERGARLLGIRPATVKTHLQHVFDKTTARRQVDLIKLIAVPVVVQAKGSP
ncbi:MAG TPA: helix-turn-helix transcriptional regulator [Steroidobacteraceae bacterium]|nr:helix-turn-helix transcriptional regulator [Steroidobacteraceae bacterium]